jgi:hypothetical protein
MRYRQNPQAPASVIAGEAAVVTPRDSRLHLLDPVATRVWELCSGEGATSLELLDSLLQEYDGPPDEMAADVSELLSQLRSLGVVDVVE